MQITIFVLIEEIIKAAMCRAVSWRKWWMVPALAFAIFEAALKIPAFLTLPSDLTNVNLKWTAAFLVAIGTSIFHFYSSLLYLATRRLLVAVATGSLVHAVYNFAVMSNKAFFILDFKSVILGWTYTFFCGLVLLAYFLLERLLVKNGEL